MINQICKGNRSIFSLIVLLVFFSGILPARAATYITDPDAIMNGAIWDEAGSPYVLETDLYMPRGRVLDVQAGVAIISGTSTDSDPKSLVLDGDFVARGTREKPVALIGLGSLSISNATSTINHANLWLAYGVSLTRASATLSGVQISGVSGAPAALMIRGSHVDISDSAFENNKSAIHSYYLPDAPVLMRSEAGTRMVGRIGGVGNASASEQSVVFDQKQNEIKISNSVITQSTDLAIYNETTNLIDARGNWWGTSTIATGPTSVLSLSSAVPNGIYGPVDASSWLTSDPRIKPVSQTCCSSVLFIPGLQASRLTFDGSRLWEPHRNDDVRKLYMNPEGVSLTARITSPEIIDGGLGYEIYEKFISTMNELVSRRKIKEWLPFPYDWRRSIEDVVAIPTQISATSSVSLLDEFINLAERSPTGRVTVIAHSNGGLVAKMLARHLEQTGRQNLIDRMIFVATPQWGTPQAIAGMLHGDNQSLGGGLLLSKGVARQLGINMPSAYGLLPSGEFFRNILGSIINVIGTSSSQLSVVNTNSLRDFLTGATDGRTQPTESKTKLPAVLTAKLFDWADRVHSTIDSFVFSSSTAVTSIVGWGRQTTRFLNYRDGRMSKDLTSFGDGTVLSEVAAGYVGDTSKDQVVYLNQNSENKGNWVSHADILESDSVRELVSVLVSTSTASASGGLPKDMSYNLPDIVDSSWIEIGIHSPVDIDVYDASGGHVGVVPNPDPTSDLIKIDNTIPGAQYDAYEDEKTVILPVRSTSTYAVKLRGTDSGAFTVSVDQYVADKRAISRSYVNLPVTPLLLASMNVGSLVDLDHASIVASSTAVGGVILSLASTTPPVLVLDFDGDGKSDASTSPSIVANLAMHIQSLRAIITSLDLDKQLKKRLLTRVDLIEKLLNRDAKDPKSANQKAQRAVDRLVSALERGLYVGTTKTKEGKHIKRTAMTEQDRQTILVMLEAILGQLERVDAHS